MSETSKSSSNTLDGNLSSPITATHFDPTKPITILKRPKGFQHGTDNVIQVTTSSCEPIAVEHPAKAVSRDCILDGACAAVCDKESKAEKNSEVSNKSHGKTSAINQVSHCINSSMEVELKSVNDIQPPTATADVCVTEGSNSSVSSGTKDTSNTASSCSEETDKIGASDSEVKLQPPRRKLPDLPADLEPLKARCTNMSQEVLGLLNQKIKEDMVKTKEAKDVVRTQQLRELSWKVADLLALGSSAVKEIEGKSPYQLQRERESKRHQNRRNKQWNQPRNFNNQPEGLDSRNDGYQSRQNNWRDNRGSQRGKRGKWERNNRSNFSGDSDPNWRAKRFDRRRAERFAKNFVKRVINKALDQLKVEEEKSSIARQEKLRSIAIDVVDSVIANALKQIIVESQAEKSNLSMTEAELLHAMCEESMSDEDSFLINVEESNTIKKEPHLVC